MNLKKLLMYVIIVLTVIIVLGVGYYLYIKKSNNEQNEITPQIELSDENLRQTIVTLYFFDIDNGTLYPEARKVDVKELLTDPYSFILSLLISGPKNEKLAKLIPEGTIIRNIEREGSLLKIDFSEEFIKNQSLGKEQEQIIIKSIINTLTELNEIERIIIKIEGEENKEFPDGGVSFKEEFLREK